MTRLKLTLIAPIATITLAAFPATNAFAGRNWNGHPGAAATSAYVNHRAGHFI